MTWQTLGIESHLYEYLLSISLREPEILTQLRQETARHPLGKMQIAPEQGQFIALLLQLIGLTLPDDGKIVACEKNEEYAAIARHWWQQAGVLNKIELHVAPATETLHHLIEIGASETFDFALIDADKSNYENYYEQALQLIRPGGLIAIDNVLWSGRVADPQIQDNRTKKIRALNQKLHQDSRITLSLVPIGDGLTLARKITNEW